VAVGEVQGEAAGNRSVEVAFRLPDGRTEARRITLRGTGDQARTYLITELLDQLRRRLRPAGR
jgi:hypothetical protein